MNAYFSGNVSQDDNIDANQGEFITCMQKKDRLCYKHVHLLIVA